VQRSELDETDLRILELLRRDGRLSIREIAREISKSPTATYTRIKRLESLGVIRGYTALIDYSKLGFGVNALTLLQVDGAHIVEVEKLLASEPNVKAVYDVTGEYDVAFISTFRSVEELDNFIKKLLRNPYIKRSVTSIILRVVKDQPHVDVPLI